MHLLLMHLLLPLLPLLLMRHLASQRNVILTRRMRIKTVRKTRNSSWASLQRHQAQLNSLPTYPPGDIMRASLLCLIILLATSGCTSFKTTIMQRASDSRLYPNQPCALTTGIPVKLKVPTHVEVTVKETYFIEKSEDAGTKRTVYRELPIKDTKSCPINPLYVTTKVIYTDKVFTVDFRRPAGGTFTLSETSFDSEQYFANLKAAYTEKTLEDIGTALTTLKTIPGIGSSGETKGNVNLSVGERQVASMRFDISELGWEDCLNEFVSQHLGPTAMICPAATQESELLPNAMIEILEEEAE